MNIIRSLRTLASIAKANPQQASDLIQYRIEKFLGVTLHWIDPTRRKVRNYEILNTSAIEPHLVPYGNYYLNPKVLPKKSTVFSIGVGEDIRFDMSFILRHEADLYLFDPTPRSERFVRKNDLPRNVQFERIAISDHDGEVLLYIDDTETNFDETTSVSIHNRGISGTAFPIPCRKISTLLKQKNIKNLDLLKIDVEGAAISILNDMFDDKIAPLQIAAEFERPTKSRDVDKFLDSVNFLFTRMKDLGYKIYRTRSDCLGFQIEILAVKENCSVE